MRVGKDGSRLQGTAGHKGIAIKRLEGRGKVNGRNARERKERKEKKHEWGRLQKRQGAAGRSPAAPCAAEGGQLEGKRRVKVAGRVKADRGACRGRGARRLREA